MIFKVQVLDGRGFGQQTQALICCASFAAVAKTTQYSVAAQEHIWNSTLTWSVSREDLRSAISNTNHCKISVLRKDGTCLGWIVISLRSAKLQGQYKSNSEGLWLPLNATKLAETPQLRVAYSLQDERHLPSAQQRSSPLIMQHSDSSSSLSSKSSTEPSSSSIGSGAGYNWAEAEGDAAAAAAGGSHRQSDKAGLAKQQRQSSAASLHSLRARSSSRRASAAAASDAAASGQDGGGPIPGSQHAEDAAAAAAAVQGAQEQPVAAQLHQGQLVQQQQERDSLQPENSGSSQARTALASNADPPDAAGEQPTQARYAAKSQVSQAACAAGAEAAPSDVPVALDALAAVEARLPSFAQRQQQQQQQQQQERGPYPQHLEQQEQAPSLLQEQRQGVEPPAEQSAQQVQWQEQLQQPVDMPNVQQQQLTAWHTAPEAQLSAAAEATQHVPAQPQQLQRAAAAAAEPAAANTAEPPAAAADASQVAEAIVAAAAAGAPASSTGQAAQAAQTEAAAVPVPAQELSLPVPDPVRDFVLTLDVRSFQAGRRLPVALGSIYVTAWLPQELIGFIVHQCNAKLPPRMTPLKTKPAVDIPRGSEGALPSGTASVSFACGVMALAGQLAAEPKVTLEVWHKERLRSDLLLGVASLPLSALLQECWVDGYAPVYALMTKASAVAGSGSNRAQPQQAQLQGDEEKVQVGLLRVVMSLEEKGPAQPVAPPPTASPIKTTPTKRRPQTQPQPQQQDASRTPAGAADTQQGADQAQQQQQQPQGLVQHAAGADAGSAQGFRQMPEYLVAWELEVWRKAEEARFRAQLQELEQQRMGVIEAAWRAREAQRQSEIASMKAKYAALEKQTRELLTATQERERVLLSAEAELRLRKAGLEREAAARMSEAEAAVRRLQVECEHQLGIERERTAAAIKQRDAAEARTAALEAQFTEYVATQRNAPEAQLKSELVDVQQAVKAAEAKLQAAVKLKQKYKQQVQQLAREVAALHHKQQQDLLQQQQQQLAAALAREQDSLAAAKKAELATLREELGKLRAAAMAADAAAFGGVHQWGRMHHTVAAAPGSPTCSSSSRGSSYRHEERQGRQHKHGRSKHDKENHHWQEGESTAAPRQQQPSWHHPHKHPHKEHQQQHSLSPEQSDGGSSSSDGESSDSSTGLLRLAAERSARETAAEVATIAAMLNPPRSASGSRASQYAAAQQQQRQEQWQGPSNSAAGVSAQRVAGAEAANADDSSGSSSMVEVRRLLKEKAELLATGLYEGGDAVIAQIDARVQALAEVAATG